MSWNLAVASANKVKAKAAVQANCRVPQFVRDAICATIDQLEVGKPFVIDSAGHLDATGGNAKFNVRTQETLVV